MITGTHHSTKLGFRQLLVAVALSLFVFPLSLLGKRLPPNPVSPVVHNGVQSSSHGDGKVGSVVATDIATGKQLWAIQVFRIHTHFWKGEEDNQWVFISDLKLVQNDLVIKDEKSRCYRLDTVTRHVEKEPCR
jgi:hypothetical protein